MIGPYCCIFSQVFVHPSGAQAHRDPKLAYYRLVNHSRKFLAIFSPKCGSTTLKDWFERSLECRENATRDHWQRRYAVRTDALASFHGYHKLLFIRNPYHRLASFYRQWVQGEDSCWAFADHDGHYSLRKKSFAEVVDVLENLHVQGIGFQHHLEPQIDEVDRIYFDEVIKMEEFDARIGAINRWKGIDYDIRHLNASTPGNTAGDDLYSGDLYARIYRLFRGDVDFYNAQAGPVVYPEAVQR